MAYSKKPKPVKVPLISTKKSICMISYIYPRKKKTNEHFRRGIFVHKIEKELTHYYNIYVLTTGYKGMKKNETAENINIERLLLKNDVDKKNYGFIFSYRIIKNLIKNKYDLIHQHFVGMSTIFIGMYCKIFRKPFILSSYGTDWELPKNDIFKNFIIKIALFFPDKIIVCSNSVKNYLKFNVNEKKIIVNYIGVDL